MIHNTRFWIPMIVFQIVFGLAVFAITRDYYLDRSESIDANTAVAGQAVPDWPNPSPEFGLAELISSFPGQTIAGDPVELTRQADEFFVNGQYVRAAELYQQLLTVNPGNVDTYNNLGITLHYLGRSDEALQTLNEGITVDPDYQRIWLTLGYVNAQLGHSRQARTALTTAIEIDTHSEVGQSASEMLQAISSD